MFQAFPLPIIRSYLLYIRRWYIPSRSDDSFPAGKFFGKIKFGKFVGLVGFIEKKFVSMDGHTNLKFGANSVPVSHLAGTDSE
jgi:hypothetical protein